MSVNQQDLDPDSTTDVEDVADAEEELIKKCEEMWKDMEEYVSRHKSDILINYYKVEFHFNSRLKKELHWFLKAVMHVCSCVRLFVTPVDCIHM